MNNESDFPAYPSKFQLELYTPGQKRISIIAIILWFILGALMLHGQEPYKSSDAAFQSSDSSPAPAAATPAPAPVATPAPVVKPAPAPASTPAPSKPEAPAASSETSFKAPVVASASDSGSPAPATQQNSTAPAPMPSKSDAPPASPPASDAALFAPPADGANGQATPTTNVTINLINRLVQRGILGKDDAAELIKQAQQDAVVARKQAQQDAVVAAQAAQPEPSSDDEVRVTYVPEVVKSEIRDQIKQEVMDQARKENWASPRAFPEWTSRFRFFGDIRTRYEGDIYPSGNDNTGGFPIFNTINTGAPFDVTGNTFSPQYNVDQNRNRFRLRARIGAEIQLEDGWSAGLRLATGNDSNPVTENQTIGGANNGQGGNFSKYAIWLDRAFIKYEGGSGTKGYTVLAGRFDNPFFSTPIIWADEIGFDGVAFKGRYQVADGFVPFLTAGAFPVFNTDFNFATNQPAKFHSEDKYLYAIQGGSDWKISEDFSTRVAVAYYGYQNIEGQLSTPFVPLTSSDQGNTDDTRPSFAQNGNTYMALRDITPTAQNNFGTINQWQYFGLATPFRELSVTARLDYHRYDPFHIALTGEFVTNTAFDRNSIAAKAVNNFGSTGQYDGGPNAWIVDLRVGSAALEKRGDWNFGINYRYVESDSVVDGFADADFGSPLTGTNLKGYTVYGSYALAKHVWLFLRFMSADAIAGPTYRNDIIQLDLNTKF